MKFQDVSHFYIGCRMLHKDGTLNLLTGSMHHWQMTGGNGFPETLPPFENWKPILHLLEDMTDAQAKTFYTAMLKKPWDERTVKDISPVEMFWKLFSDEEVFPFGPLIVAQLLRMNFDLFSLVLEGQAINAKHYAENPDPAVHFTSDTSNQPQAARPKEDFPTTTRSY